MTVKSTPQGIEVTSDTDTTSPEIENGENKRCLTNDDEFNEGSPLAPLGPSSRSPSPLKGRHVSNDPFFLEQLDQAEEHLDFKAVHSDESPLPATLEAKSTSSDDGSSDTESIYKGSNTDGKVSALYSRQGSTKQ